MTSKLLLIKFLHCNRLKDDVNKIVNWLKWSIERSSFEIISKFLVFVHVSRLKQFLIFDTSFQRNHFSEKCHPSLSCSTISNNERSAKNLCFSTFNCFVQNWFENKKRFISTTFVDNLIWTKNVQQHLSRCNDKNWNEIDLYRKIKMSDSMWTSLKKKSFVIKVHRLIAFYNKEQRYFEELRFYVEKAFLHFDEERDQIWRAIAWSIFLTRRKSSWKSYIIHWTKAWLMYYFIRAKEKLNNEYWQFTKTLLVVVILNFDQRRELTFVIDDQWKLSAISNRCNVYKSFVKRLFATCNISLCMTWNRCEMKRSISNVVDL